MVRIHLRGRCCVIDFANSVSLGRFQIEQYADHIVDLDVYVPSSGRERVAVYVAAICGADETYKLRRVFIKPEMDYCIDLRIYSYTLKNGVYEVGYSRYETQGNKRLERVRSLLILLDGRLYSYPYDEFGSEYILYTAYSVWLQILDEELAARMFFRKEVRDNA